MTRPKIYESPDKGETIYSREIGSTDRELISESPRKKSLHEQMLEDKMWGEIRRLAKTNPALKDAVDKVIMIYHLVKDRK
jgi:hypothetical protein